MIENSPFQITFVRNEKHYNASIGPAFFEISWCDATSNCSLDSSWTNLTSVADNNNAPDPYTLTANITTPAYSSCKICLLRVVYYTTGFKWNFYMCSAVTNNQVSPFTTSQSSTSASVSNSPSALFVLALFLIFLLA